MQEKELLTDISKKLDLIVGLLLQLRTSKRGEKEDILGLRDAGLTVDEIARILGKSRNAVYLVISRSRKLGPAK